MEPNRRLTGDDLRRFRRVTVMGLGLFGGGAGAARYFAERGASVVVTDLADEKKLARSVERLDGLGIVFRLGGHADADFAETDLVVTNQAVRPDNKYLQLARRHGIPVATETGLALGLNRSPWAAVTGSSGKSTAAALLAAMLTAHDPDTLFGGNIGGDLLTRMEGRPERSPLVVELSSFQLTYVADDFASGRAAPPNVAVVTNITPNHLDWHRDMEEYIAAKESLLRYQTPDNWAILNVDDPLLAEWAGTAKARAVQCAMSDPGADDACYVDRGDVVLRLGGTRAFDAPLDTFRLIGRHNIANALQAVAAAHAMSAGADAIRAGFAEFAGLPHRLEMIGRIDGKLFINDSKATTPEATVLALASVDAPSALIAGGHDKLSPFGELARAIQSKAVGLVLVGPAGQRLEREVLAAAAARPAAMGKLPVRNCNDDFPLAVATAFSLAPPGGAVLLSPGCASYGMFTNYEERGDVFRELTAELEHLC